MTIRKHADLPTLREGCYPVEGERNPPHHWHNSGDGISIYMVQVEDYDALPAIHVPTGNTREVRDIQLIECVTGNGWRCYLTITDQLSLISLLSLASAGRGGVQQWMRGEPYHEAWQYAERTLESLQQRREDGRTRGDDPIPLNLEDIDI